MSTTYPLVLPSSSQFTSVHFDMADAIGQGESPFDFSQETFEHDGRRWEATVQVVRLDRASAEEWLAFLAELRGRKGTFLMGDPAAEIGRGTLTGTPLVAGTGQSGQVINIDGCGTSVTGWIKKGDYVQFGTGASARLHKQLKDASSGTGGGLSLDLWPGPRTALTDNDPVIVGTAQGLWRLAANRRGWDLDEAIRYGISFAAVEAL